MSRDVGVIVIAYNSERYIGALLDSLPAALGSLEADVVVVDNGSADATRSLVAGRTDCRLITRSNDGFAAAINAGRAFVADAEAVLILNPDLRLTPNSVSELFADLSTRPLGPHRVGIVVPRIVDDQGTLSWSLRREPTLPRALGLGATKIAVLSETVQSPSAYDTAHAVTWATGAAMLVSRRCFEETGSWDESFFLYSEETDFCLRARDSGWLTWFCPQATVAHVGGGSGSSMRLHSMQQLNRVRLYVRRHNVVAGYAYWVITVLAEMTWVLRGRSATWEAVRALLVPSRRPAELRSSHRLLPG